jgi:hypothetical protein
MIINNLEHIKTQILNLKTPCGYHVKSFPQSDRHIRFFINY